MTLNEARHIHGLLIKAVMFTSGTSSIDGAELDIITGKTLFELVTAQNMAVADAKENNKELSTVEETAIADFFIRQKDPNYLSADDLTNLCQGADYYFPDTPNGHALLIDGGGHYTMVELTPCGADVHREFSTHNSPQELFEHLKSVINEKITKTNLGDN